MNIYFQSEHNEFLLQRRSGMISHFLCGVAIPPETPGERPRLFHSFCKVSVSCVFVSDVQVLIIIRFV